MAAALETRDSLDEYDDADEFQSAYSAFSRQGSFSSIMSDAPDGPLSRNGPAPVPAATALAQPLARLPVSRLPSMPAATMTANAITTATASYKAALAAVTAIGSGHTAPAPVRASSIPLHPSSSRAANADTALATQRAASLPVGKAVSGGHGVVAIASMDAMSAEGNRPPAKARSAPWFPGEDWQNRDAVMQDEPSEELDPGNDEDIPDEPTGMRILYGDMAAHSSHTPPVWVPSKKREKKVEPEVPVAVVQPKRSAWCSCFRPRVKVE